MRRKRVNASKSEQMRRHNEIDITQIVKKKKRAHTNINCIQIRLLSFQLVYNNKKKRNKRMGEEGDGACTETRKTILRLSRNNFFFFTLNKFEWAMKYAIK